MLACIAADCMYRNDCYGIQLDFRSNFLCDSLALPNLGDTSSRVLLPANDQKSIAHIFLIFSVAHILLLTFFVDSLSLWNTCKKYSRTEPRFGPFSTAKHSSTCSGDWSFSCAENKRIMK